jgi:hypothetical protein
MAITQQSGFQILKDEVRSRDMTILVGYVTVSILLLLLIYLASVGTAPGDLAPMTAFP